MTIRTRLTLWYLGMLLLSLLLMSGVLYYEVIYEHRPEVPPERRESTTTEVTDILVYYGAPSLALLLLGSWFLMRRALAPIAALIEAAERVHSRNLRAHLPRTGNGDELDRLTGVFNAMLARLDDSFGRVREFTLHASHELKTPLTVLRGEIETQLRDDECAPARRDALASQLDEILRLTQIVDQLALLTKADSGLIALAQEDVRLDELVREAVENASVLGGPLNLKVELGQCKEVIVRGDRHRLRQLLLSLTDNAAKYNEPGGRVALDLRVDGSQTAVTVENTGPGIAPDQLSRVFDRFFRGDSARRTFTDGTGLGLSIAQWIVTAHGGTISVQSEVQGLTRITVRLPVSGK